MELLKIAGFNVLYEQKKSELATVRIVVNAGSTDEKDKKDYGVAHYLEHMFFKGTESKDYKQINMEMSEIGNANAYTHYGRTVYYLSTLGEDYIKALSLLTEMLFEPSLLEEEFEKERNVILEECQARLDNPQGYFFDKSGQIVWGDDGHEIIGSKETISNMTIEQLKSFRNTYYNKNNIYIVIIGDIAEDDLKKDCLMILSKYSGYFDGKSIDKEYEEFVPGEDTYLTHDAEQSILGMYFRAWSDYDLKSCKFISDVFENGLGGGMHSLLFDRVREELGLCYSISSYGASCRKKQSTIISTMLDKENIDLAKEEIEKVLDKVKKEGFSEEILRVSKKNVIFNLASSISSPSGYAGAFCDRYFVQGDINFEMIKELTEKITNKDIIEYANWITEPGYQIICQNK